MEPIFKTSFLGFSVKVYPNRVEYNPLFMGKRIILAKQIASVEMGMPGVQELIIETAGGKRQRVVVHLGAKTALRDAILGIVAS